MMRNETAVLDKVTAFITRSTPNGKQLLLFQHPNFSIQVPAGTVEAGEDLETAVLREANEETGLDDLAIQQYLGSQIDPLPPQKSIIQTPTTVYGRADAASFNFARLPRGAVVERLRHADGFTQVTFKEDDRWPDPQFVSYQITGWVPDETLAHTQRRHFYHLTHHGRTPDTWIVPIDFHQFKLFWASFENLPKIVSPQKDWLVYWGKNSFTKSAGLRHDQHRRAGHAIK